jgi:soluble lytic murein transglycosylase-like protein
MNNDLWGYILLVAVVLALIAIIAIATTRAHAEQQPNLNNADFIADQQFIRWTEYACGKSSDRGLNAVTMIEAAARKAEVEHYGIMVCVAWYESRFKPDVVSRNGRYRGMLQIGASHQQAMESMGLDYSLEEDRLHYGMLLYKWHGLQPWGVRSRARRDYRLIIGGTK